MSTTTERPRAGWLLGLAVFVSACLLFQVQPLISKAILPWFGGTPSVWTTCMLFFQVVLFAGYAYAHLVATRVPGRFQGLLHLLLLAAAVSLLHVLPGPEWKPDGDESPALRIVLLLLSTVGLPYFVLSSTGPLLQRWFSLLAPGRSPYRLYALSNVGSLLALLSYPFVFEPLLPMQAQDRLWSIGFLVFAGLCAICGVRLFLVLRGRALDPVPSEAQAAAAVPSLGRYVLWFALAMTASAMLLATTNQVCQDVAVIPFLWVVPLSLYLLSFILCFDSDRWYSRRGYALAAVVAIASVCWLLVYGLRVFLPLQVAIYFAALFAICMLCHGELARRRPDPRYLTAFYLTISGGGAGGGLFVALAAPVVFPDFWELHLCLAAGALLAIVVYFRQQGWLGETDRPPLFWSAAAIMLITLVGTVFADDLLNYQRSVAMTRNFYGVLEIELDEPDNAVIMRHGRIIHGLQLRSPEELRTPTTYYNVQSGVGRAMRLLQARQPRVRVGLVGLGVGTLAAYGRAGDDFRFYEINADVLRLAEQHFTFLADTPASVETRIGDARLSLEHEPPQQFDLLVLDAFSGDAIPTHLLTREAMQMYVTHLQPDGLIAIHISNLHFDLRSVTAALADACDLYAITVQSVGTHDPVDPSSLWVLLARDPRLLQAPLLQEAVIESPAKRVLWTDDFSNLLHVLR